jgi:hypothetical protein
VDEHSGIMDIPGERIVPMQNYDHRTMCRFQDESSNGYKIISGILHEWADEALESA